MSAEEFSLSGIPPLWKKSLKQDKNSSLDKYPWEKSLECAGLEQFLACGGEVAIPGTPIPGREFGSDAVSKGKERQITIILKYMYLTSLFLYIKISCYVGNTR